MNFENENTHEALTNAAIAEAVNNAAAQVQEMLTINQALSDALFAQSGKVAELQKRIDDMLEIGQAMVADYDESMIAILPELTIDGTHVERNKKALYAVRVLAKLAGRLRRDYAEMGRRADGVPETDWREMDDIPF